MAKAYQFLTLPDRTDNVSLDVLNNNFKAIADRQINSETILNGLSSSVSGIAANLSNTDRAVSAMMSSIGNIAHMRVMQNKYVSFTNGYANIVHDAGIKLEGCIITQTWGSVPLLFMYDNENSTSTYVTIKAWNLDGTPFSGQTTLSAFAFTANNPSIMSLEE